MINQNNDVNHTNIFENVTANIRVIDKGHQILTIISIGYCIGPKAKTESSPIFLVYMNLVPAASYVPGELTANSPFIMYDPLDIFNAKKRQDLYT